MAGVSLAGGLGGAASDGDTAGPAASKAAGGRRKHMASSRKSMALPRRRWGSFVFFIISSPCSIEVSGKCYKYSI